MAAVPRGVIRNREYGTQVRDFSGLRFGKITPTDIDGLIEYQNKGYVFIETKYKDAKLPRGQELALERLCDDLQNTKPTLLIIASHETEGDIDVAETIVARYRFKGEWSRCRGTTGRLVAAFIGHLDKLWNREDN
jgi:glycerophosphoryl diester phosphodiesterase